ncbi:MAG: AIR synthase related protein, partial [Myxococcota bacterium]|nr:AIR synthase related protein [Myxococcota bacterium]
MCQHVPNQPAPIGPGDDGAADGERVITVDLMVEGVHFLRPHPPEWLGHKLLAVNLSDVGAMGAIPSGFLLTAALPEDTPPT